MIQILILFIFICFRKQLETKLGIITDPANNFLSLRHAVILDGMPSCWMHQLAGLLRENMQLLRRVVTAEYNQELCHLIAAVERAADESRFSSWKDLASYSHQEVLRLVILFVRIF